MVTLHLESIQEEIGMLQAGIVVVLYLLCLVWSFGLMGEQKV